MIEKRDIVYRNKLSATAVRGTFSPCKNFMQATSLLNLITFHNNKIIITAIM